MNLEKRIDDLLEQMEFNLMALQNESNVTVDGVYVPLSKVALELAKQSIECSELIIDLDKER